MYLLTYYRIKPYIHKLNNRQLRINCISTNTSDTLTLITGHYAIEMKNINNFTNNVNFNQSHQQVWHLKLLKRHYLLMEELINIYA